MEGHGAAGAEARTDLSLTKVTDWTWTPGRAMASQHGATTFSLPHPSHSPHLPGAQNNTLEQVF